MRIVKRNSIPFFILLLIHTVLIGLSFYKSKNKKNVFILLLSNMGVAYLFEYFVLNLFKGYIYKPKVFKNLSIDNVFGAFLSQGIFIPFTAVYLTISKANWPLKIIGGIYFTLIEILFLKLGIFKHKWWRTIYTLILIPIHFKWSDFWFSCLNKKKEIVRFVSFFLMVMVTETNLFLLFAMIRKFRFGLGKLHMWTEHFIVSPLYSITTSLFTVVLLKKNNNGSTKLGVVFIAACLNEFFVSIKLLKNKMQFIEYIFIRIIMVFVYGQFRKWVYEEKTGENQ